jgi:hypothetical protein
MKITLYYINKGLKEKNGLMSKIGAICKSR